MIDGLAVQGPREISWIYLAVCVKSAEGESGVKQSTTICFIVFTAIALQKKVTESSHSECNGFVWPLLEVWNAILNGSQAKRVKFRIAAGCIHRARYIGVQSLSESVVAGVSMSGASVLLIAGPGLEISNNQSVCGGSRGASP